MGKVGVCCLPKSFPVGLEIFWLFAKLTLQANVLSALFWSLGMVNLTAVRLCWSFWTGTSTYNLVLRRSSPLAWRFTEISREDRSPRRHSSTAPPSFFKSSKDLLIVTVGFCLAVSGERARERERVD